MLLVFGGMHGNELAGVQALDNFFILLEHESANGSAPPFKGRFLGLRGNMGALARGTRYVVRDLNRHWTDAHVDRIMSTPHRKLEAEDKELHEILTLIRNEIEAYKPERVVVLDLHTTTASGGIFSIPTDDPESVRLAVELHAPVVKGLLHCVSGTTLHYFRTENVGVPTVAITFEAGQHHDQLSVNRSMAAITNCMRTIGCVQSEHVLNRYDKLLEDWSRDLPKVTELIMRHSILPEDDFRMKPNYRNFQPVRKGEILAVDRYGDIRAKADGRILMPLYQEQGDDGFFLIRQIEFF